MKTLCVALGLLVALQGAWSFSEEIKECAEEHSVKADDMNKFFESKEAPKDVKCFMKCVMLHMEVLKDDGSFDLDALKEHEKDEDLVAPFRECMDDGKTDSDDLCEVAFHHAVCMLEKVPEGKFQKGILEHLA